MSILESVHVLGSRSLFDNTIHVIEIIIHGQIITSLMERDYGETAHAEVEGGTSTVGIDGQMADTVLKIGHPGSGLQRVVLVVMY